MRVVKCSSCGEVVYQYLGGSIGNDRFHGIKGYESPELNCSLECPACGSDWYMVFREDMRLKKGFDYGYVVDNGEVDG